ncbi:hypothetical protein DUNSADRAFT_8122 [Dunaliella salina]|uniref:Uncharacterized protein n=1 Tax=Dunaliella salina TaxID=3046 RepID=A0ABQ7GJY6_DUNSA|nr:hypothetical protein DUNSADRAFT_8122 [Dunaliella salina]|eukprot:KAF5834934.1 hypothetical protein DUNSADRAFT_8122 [Dunaliella salina]
MSLVPGCPLSLSYEGCCKQAPAPTLSHPCRHRTHRRHQHVPTILRQACPPFSKPQSSACTHLSATASTHRWLDPPHAETQPQGAVPPSAADKDAAAAAEDIVCFVSRNCLPSLTASSACLLSSLPLPASASAPSSARHKQAVAEERQYQQEQQQQEQQLHHRDERVGVSGGPQSLPLGSSDSVQQWVLWIEQLHEWYSVWQAMSTSTEALLYLVPPSAAKARTSSTRLFVQLNQLERQLSGSSAMHHALDRCIAFLQEVNSNSSNPISGGGGSFSDKRGSKSVSASNSKTELGQAETEADAVGFWQRHPEGLQGKLDSHESTSDQQQGQQQQQQLLLLHEERQPHQHPHQWALTEALRQAHAVKQCMQQGSYQPKHEQAFSVVLTAQEKEQMLEGYRDHERALLAQAQRLLHAAEAAPEAEVSAQELREDPVLAQVVQGPPHEKEEDGCLHLTLEACALLLHHHPDSSVRQQVYELGVEGRCLRALQLMDQLADVRLKIARCCGYPSYSHLSQSGPTAGSSCTPTASMLLTQLVEALGPAAQQQVQQHGHAAIAAASADNTCGGEDGAVAGSTGNTRDRVDGSVSGAVGGGEGLDDARIESALLQALAPHGLDYAPSPVEVSELQPHQIPEQQHQQQQTPTHDEATALGIPLPPGLPPLPCLLAGISEFLRTTLGIWFELEDPLPAGNLKVGMKECGQPGAISLGGDDFSRNADLGGDAGGSGCSSSSSSSAHHQLLRRFLRQLQLSAFSGQSQVAHDSAQQQQQNLVVATVHHEEHSCIGTLVVHPTAACGTRYLCMEGSPRSKQRPRSDQFEDQAAPQEAHRGPGPEGCQVGQHRPVPNGHHAMEDGLGPHGRQAGKHGPGPDDFRMGARPMVLIGLHGFKGQGRTEESLLPHSSSVADPRPSALVTPEQEGQQQQLLEQQKGGQQHVLEHKIGRQQQQQQQQQQQRRQQTQQDVLLSESALCLWELLHELGHALHMLLSWKPVQASPSWAAAKSSKAKSGSSSSGSSSSSSSSGGGGGGDNSSSSDNGSVTDIRRESRHSSKDGAKQRSASEQMHGAATSTVLPAALVDCPLQLPLELLELPSTLMELTGAQPQCVTTILAAAHRHHQRTDHTSRMITNKEIAPLVLQRGPVLHGAAPATAAVHTGNDRTSNVYSSGSGSSSSVGTLAVTPEQLGAALAGEVRRQLYRPLQLQVQALTALLDQLLLCRNHSSPTSAGAPQEAIALWVGLCEGALPLGLDPLFTCQQAQSLYRVMELRGRYAGYPVAWLLATSAWHHHGLDKDPTSPNAWRTLGRLVFEGLQQDSSAVYASLPDAQEQGGPGLAWDHSGSQGSKQPRILEDRDEQDRPSFARDYKGSRKQPGILADREEQEGPGFARDCRGSQGRINHDIPADRGGQGRQGFAWLQALVGPDRVRQLSGDQQQRGSGSTEPRTRELTDGEPGLLQHLIVDARAFTVCL